MCDNEADREARREEIKEETHGVEDEEMPQTKEKKLESYRGVRPSRHSKGGMS
jgi:hypothetical protein